MGSHVSHFAGSPIGDWESHWTISKKMTAYEGKREPYSGLSLSPFGFHLSILSSSKPGLLCMLSVKENVFWLFLSLFSALEYTHCARMWLYMSESLFIVRFWISTKVVYLQHWHGWCHMKLLPSQHRFCVHHTTMHHVTSCKATCIWCMCV